MPSRESNGPATGSNGHATVAQARLLQLLRDAGEPLTVTEVADRTQQHVTTVREHLAGLIERRLVVRERARGGGAGRPPWRYRVNPEAELSLLADWSTWSGIVEAVAVAAEQAPDPAAAATVAGRAWGRQLGSRLADQGTAERVTLVMTAFGFAPDRTGESSWWLRRCPFSEAKINHGGTVCATHHGLLQGLLDDDTAAAATLTPRAEDTACRFEVPAQRLEATETGEHRDSS